MSHVAEFVKDMNSNELANLPRLCQIDIKVVYLASTFLTVRFVLISGVAVFG